MLKTTMEKEEQLGAWPAQACGFVVSASLSDAGARTGHQQQAAQQEPLGLSVCIECYQSATWLWGHKKQGPFVREIIVSFKRSPPEDLDGSCPARSTCRPAHLWKATQPQQQDGLEDREVQQPESQGQGFSLRCSGGLNDTSMQVMQEQLGAQAPIIKPVALIREQKHENATDAELSEEEEWADAIDTELSEEEEWEDAIDTEVSDKEEWQDTIGTELSQGIDAVGSPPVHHRVSSLGLEDNTELREGPSFPSSVGRETAGEAADKLLRASPAPANAQLADSALLVAPKEEEHHTPLKHGEAEPPASSAPVEAARAAGAENQAPAPHGPTADGPAQVDTAQSMEAEGLDKAVLIVQGLDEPSREMWGQEQSKDKVTGDKATAEGPENLEVGPQSPTTDAPLLLNSADYIRTEIIKRAWLMIQEPVQELEEEWEQERSMDEATAATARAEGPESPPHAPHSPTVDTPLLLDMADYIRTDVVKRAWLMIQEPVQQPEEKWEQEGSGDKVTTATARADGPESPLHAPYSPPVSNPPLLDMAKYVRAEIVKKAHHLVQRPFQEVKEQQDQKQSSDEAIARPAGCAYSLLASTVLNTPAHEGWLSHALRLRHRREAEEGTNSRYHRPAGHSPGDQN
ncbi:uncharacterized protein LOC128782455 [Vidua chalybeata]|uniref:uncharacterized protein LOC128782455 n=1 Tax=Vidua chalybeata TaxID=81927 RepID=UPI0023A80AD5|nr:uncharacterized protein LOC128782455 [Vidua chalybeata]